MLYERKENLFNTQSDETLEKLVKKSKQIKRDSEDYVIPMENLKNMNFTENGTLIFNHNDAEDMEVNLGRTAFTQICNKVGVPVKYMDDCISIGRNDLVSENINTWIKELDPKRGALARLYKGNNMRGFLSTDYSIFDSDEILDVVGNQINLNHYELKGHLLNEERLHLRFVEREPIALENDKDIFTGFCIDSSDVGRNTLTCKFFIFKQICTNGLIVTKSSNRLLHQIHRGISKDKFVSSFENCLDMIDELREEAIQMINHADRNEIPYFEEYKDYEKFVKNVSERTQISQEMIDKAIEVMDERYNHTAWGLINGITDLAQSKKFERRIELETLASNLLLVPDFIK